MVLNELPRFRSEARLRILLEDSSRFIVLMSEGDCDMLLANMGRWSRKNPLAVEDTVPEQ
jgi:hypothetical protein